MGKVAAGPLVQDSLSSYIDSLIDPATGTFYFKRGVNLNVSANGDYADSTSVLYGPDGNVLFAAAAAPGDADSATIKGPYINSRLQGYDGINFRRLRVDNSGQLIVNVEQYPGPTVLADNTANPTTTQIQANVAIYNPGNGLWSRAQGIGTTGPGYTGSQGFLIEPMLANNAGSLDPQVNNTQGTLLASAARTGTTTSSTQTNYNAKGVIVFLNITVASGTGGLIVLIQSIDPVSGSNVQLGVNPTAITATGRYGYMLYPGVSGGNTGSGEVQATYSGVLARSWQVTVGVGDSSSYTYSVGYALIV